MPISNSEVKIVQTPKAEKRDVRKTELKGTSESIDDMLQSLESSLKSYKTSKRE